MVLAVEPVELAAEAAKRRPVSNCTSGVKLGCIVLAGTTAGEPSDGDNVLASDPPVDIRNP